MCSRNIGYQEEHKKWVRKWNRYFIGKLKLYLGQLWNGNSRNEWIFNRKITHFAYFLYTRQIVSRMPGAICLSTRIVCCKLIWNKKSAHLSPQSMNLHFEITYLSYSAWNPKYFSFICTSFFATNRCILFNWQRTACWLCLYRYYNH